MKIIGTISILIFTLFAHIVGAMFHKKPLLTFKDVSQDDAEFRAKYPNSKYVNKYRRENEVHATGEQPSPDTHHRIKTTKKD